MATEQYEGYSPQLADDWAGHEVSQLQHDSTSNPAIPQPATDDLAYKPNTRGNSFNNPPPSGWLYPHKKGIGTGSNLEPFKAEIESRTQRGENCKAIAVALNAMGVQTSDRAVSRVRIRWGMRKRAQRKVKTPPPDADNVRMSAKSKVQAMRKAELIRMTREGMTPEEIYQDLTSRGMELKKGVATVLRLQSAWGVARDEKRWLGNFRHQCHKKAKAQQADAFTDIAKELGVQEVKVWVQEKMKEQAARQARHELALKLMGEHAPTNPERRKLQKPRRENGPSEGQGNANDAEDDLDSGSSEDEHGSASPFSGPVTDLRFELADPARQDGHVPHDVQLLSPHGNPSGARSTGYTPDPINEPSSAGRGVEGGVYHEYPPLHDRADDSMYDSGGEQHGSAGAPSHTPTGIVELIPHATPASPMSTHPLPSFHHPNALDPNMSSQPAEISPTRTAPTSTTAVLAGHGEGHAGQSNGSGGPAPKAAASAASGLVLAPEETEANKSTLSALDQYNDAARVYKELLEARNSNQPLAGSLTGMAPSAKELETAKRKLKDATQAMMLALD
ncbi:hypothetical protein KVR01_003692 [Diaporthe batatas]|uniref:uncharacterized protein n=1 Tax=Diaporthe batatas TaxID=748121 RepID=UPI001D057654|nr:uncharacterized protein KVR01_003692 [Diaporthe batatas]KAG8168003.1 hypothetical protein KVR01_003692 [Diaporthe batatas]